VPLNARQARFAKEYPVDLNATKAAIRAGYSPHTASRIGSRLLKNVEIQAAIAAAGQRIEERTEITQDMVVRELARVAFSDGRKLYRPDGSLKPPSEWDDETAAVVSGVETIELFEGAGRDRRHIGHKPKVKRWDKVKALELLGRRFGMFLDRTRDETPRPPAADLSNVTREQLLAIEAILAPPGGHPPGGAGGTGPAGPAPGVGAADPPALPDPDAGGVPPGVDGGPGPVPGEPR